MLPTPEQFAREVGALGIADSDTIVVYDGVGLGGAPRVWWTFRIFGAKNVFILDGGLPKLKAEACDGTESLGVHALLGSASSFGPAQL